MGYYGNQPATGENNSFRVLDDLSSYTLTFDGSSAGVVSIANDTLTFLNHRFVTGQRVTYNDGGGTAIGGLSDGVYYIVKNDQNTIKLAPTYADAIGNTNLKDLTSLGVGSSHTLNVAFDGVNTRFVATYGGGRKVSVSRAAQLQISINGVIQEPQDSKTPTAGFGSDLDSVIVFSVAPTSTDVFWGNAVANNFPTFDISDNTVDNFTGDGTSTEFTLSKSAVNNDNVLVTLDGVVQYPSDATTTRAYSVTANIITFASAPGLGVDIQVRHIGFAGATTSAVTGFYGRTGNATLISTDDIIANSIGIGTDATVGAGLTSLHVFGQSQLNRVAITTTASNLTLEAGRTFIYYSTGTYTLPASPTAGDRIEIINRSGTVSAVLARNGSNIMGVADDLDLDILDATFKVTYSNDTDGWVVGT
jgi:hypothetical protein